MNRNSNEFYVFLMYADMDECIANLHNCSEQSEQCKNTVGSFDCDCAPEYIRNGDRCECMFYLGSNALIH